MPNKKTEHINKPNSKNQRLQSLQHSRYFILLLCSGSCEENHHASVFNCTPWINIDIFSRKLFLTSNCSKGAKKENNYCVVALKEKINE